MKTLIKTIFWTSYIFIAINTFLYFKPITQEIETIKKDNILIDIIQHNYRKEYFTYATINNLSPNVMKQLVDKNEIFDLNILNLHYAIENDLSSYFLMYIIYHNPLSLLEQNDYYEYPLHVALKKKLNVDIIQELLVKGRETLILENCHEFEIEEQLDRNDNTIFELLANY